MKFKISEKRINKKLIVDIVIIIFIAFIFLTKGLEIGFDLEANIIISLLLIAMLGASYYDFVITKKKLQNNSLKINSNGIMIQNEGQLYSILWSEIKDIEIKTKKSNVTKLFIITTSDKFDLSEYENLNELKLKIDDSVNNL